MYNILNEKHGSGARKYIEMKTVQETFVSFAARIPGGDIYLFLVTTRWAIRRVLRNWQDFSIGVLGQKLRDSSGFLPAISKAPQYYYYFMSCVLFSRGMMWLMSHEIYENCGKLTTFGIKITREVNFEDALI